MRASAAQWRDTFRHVLAERDTNAREVGAQSGTGLLFHVLSVSEFEATQLHEQREYAADTLFAALLASEDYEGRHGPCGRSYFHHTSCAA